MSMKQRRIFFVATALALAGVWGGGAWAHGVKAGHLVIEHPYATPSLPAMTTGAVYFRSLRNGGDAPDRLVSASTPVAATVEIHRMQMQGDVMQMRQVKDLPLAAGAAPSFRHNSREGYHLMLRGLKAPLADGERFPVTLRFEHQGPVEVSVWVQTPKDEAAGTEHRH